MIKCPDLSFIDLNFKLKASSSDTHTKYIPEAALDLPSPPFPHQATPGPATSPHLDLGSPVAGSSLQPSQPIS